jgi:tRNA-Thr(GGU) m(6)t(6)A37 methyltransferase TsaA
MTKETGWQLQAIGVVRSEAKERKQLPPLGLPATIELFPEYQPGLLHLEKHTHLWVLVWLHGAERDRLQVTPRGVCPEDPDALHGVFAVRSPVRPNPIGLTLTRIERVEGCRIQVARLDFIDGTPVIDLKPYFVSRDLAFGARNARIGRPAGRENLRESLREQAINFHGEECPELALGVRLIEHFFWDVLQLKDLGTLKILAPRRRGCLLDALMGMTRVSLGRGTLDLIEGDSVVLEHSGAQCRYHLLPPAGRDAAAILSADPASLFEFRPAPRE